MKVKRTKRAKRILNFFRFNYQYTEPYNIIVDGTFCQAALQNKVNLREQIPKYLDSGVDIYTTKCVLEELKLLGHEVYGALKVCENFEVVKCPHNPIRTAAQCMEHMGRRSKNPVHQKFIIASQDEQLLFNMRDFGGVPLMSIRFNAVQLEKPSKASENLQKEETHEFKVLEDLKKTQNAGETKKKRKGPKAPNPLSCKKKKRLDSQPKPVPLDNVEKKKPARRRKKKPKPEDALPTLKMLQVMEKNGWAAPVTIFATHLNAPCSSILLAQSQIPSKVYLIIGKVNGETVFFPLDRSECVSKFESEHCEPITALASGDLQNNSTKEVVTVSSNGLLQSLRFPKSENMSDAEPPIPSRVFFQQLNSNIICCEIMDVDNDGQNEFFVVMTDKTLRSYRFSTENRCLIAQNKWEMPSQISGCSISTGSSGNYFAYLSQACKSDFIRLDFGPLKNVSIMHSKGVDRKHSTLLFIPPNPKTIRLMQSLISKIIVVDGEGSEIELHNKAGDFVCVAHTQLPSGISIVMSICPFGNLFVYAFTSDDVLSEPVARCQVLRDVDHCASFPGPSSYSLFLSLVNIYNKVAIYLIDFSHIIQIRQIM